MNRGDLNTTNENGNGLTHVSLDKTLGSNDLTDEDIERMKETMKSELSPAQLEHLGQILLKFKKGTTTKDHIEGMVSAINNMCIVTNLLQIFYLHSQIELLVFGVATKSNATDDEIKTLFEGDTQTTTPITLNSNTNII